MGRARDLANLLNSSGLVPDAKVLALAASKLTGQVPDANAPSGSVLQVVYGTTDTEVSTASTSVWTDTTLSASITPSSASSKILVLVGQSSVDRQVGAGGVKIKLLRGSTDLIAVTGVYGAGWMSGSSSTEINVGSVAFEYLDSPSTTSPVTYKTQLQLYGSGVGVVQHGGGARSTITLLEVAA